MNFPPGIVVTQSPVPDSFFNDLNKATVEWTMRAARGECGWICSDCCVSSSEGMPDGCFHGNDWCTAIIQRDKKDALQSA